MGIVQLLDGFIRHQRQVPKPEMFDRLNVWVQYRRRSISFDESTDVTSSARVAIDAGCQINNEMKEKITMK